MLRNIHVQAFLLVTHLALLMLQRGDFSFVPNNRTPIALHGRDPFGS